MTDLRNSLDYWKLQHSHYSFHARRRKGNPSAVNFRRHTQMPYLVCPLDGLYSLWGFETQETAQLFDARYPLALGEDLTFDLMNGQSVIYLCPHADIARHEYHLFRNYGQSRIEATYVTTQLTGFTQESPLKRGTFIRFVSVSALPYTIARGTDAIIKVHPRTDTSINGWDQEVEHHKRYLKSWW